jgi:hypothetical protein
VVVIVVSVFELGDEEDEDEDDDDDDEDDDGEINEFVDDNVDVFVDDVDELPVTAALNAAFIAAAALNASALLVEKLKLHKLLKLNEDDEWEDAAAAEAADKADWKCGNDEDKK